MRAVTLLGLLLALLCLQGMEAQVKTSKMETSEREPLSPQTGNLYFLKMETSISSKWKPLSPQKGNLYPLKMETFISSANSQYWSHRRFGTWIALSELETLEQASPQPRDQTQRGEL